MIRALHPGDEDALRAHVVRHYAENELGDEPFMPPQPLEQLLRYYEPLHWDWCMASVGWQRVWGAWFDGELVAHVTLTGSPWVLAGHRCSLGMGVELRARRRGIGRTLMALALDWARDQAAVQWVDLNVLANNYPALALDAAMGFLVVGETRDAFRVGARSFGCAVLALDLHASKMEKR